MAVGKKKIQHTDGVSSLVNQNNIKTEFQDLLSVIQSFKSQLSLMAGKVKNLEKSVNKKIKTLEKEAAKNRNKGNRKPSGFATPTKISDDLCKFMNKPKASALARTEVTKYIISYIKDNNLQSTTNKKIMENNIKILSIRIKCLIIITLKL